VNLRRLGTDDAEHAIAFVHMMDRPKPDAGAMGAWLADDHNVMVGAWVGDEPAGMAYGYHLARPDGGADMLLLYSIDTAEAHRSQGIATRLMEEMKTIARGRMWLLTNESNQAAMALYEKAGGHRKWRDDVMWVF